jgi:hypothetical protein
MIYVIRDFYSNFSAATSGKDADSQRDMLISEIGDLIAHDKKDVAEALSTVGIKTDESESNKKIIAKIVNNFSNEKLQLALSYLIANKHGLSVATENKEGIKNPVKAISEGMALLVKDIADKKITSQQFVESLTQSADAQGGEEKSNAGLFIGLGIAAVVIGAIYYTARK